MNDISYWVSTRCKLIKAGQAYYSKFFAYAWIICCAVEVTCKSKIAGSSPSRHSDLKIVVCGPTNTNPRTSELRQPIWASCFSISGTLLSHVHHCIGTALIGSL